MTVMFVDLVDSTGMTERHAEEDVRDITRRYQVVAANAIRANGGFVARYAGDGILAYFGYPAAREDDARRAVHAGLSLRDGLRDLAEQVRREHGIELAARVGIHTGVVLTGDMGVPGAPDRHAIVGRAPNEAKRVESAAPPGEVAISDTTADIVRGYFEMASIGRPPMKGVGRSVEVFRVVCATTAVDRLQAAGPVLTPFAGRTEEVSTLRAAWDAVLTPRSDACPVRVVLLRGDAGIGKSRIARKLVATATEEGSTVFVGTCAPDRVASPLFPIARMLDSYIGSSTASESLPPIAKLEKACGALGLPSSDLPLYADVLGFAPSADYRNVELGTGALRERIFQAIVAFICATARRQRTLVVIEDVQWADLTSLDLLTRLTAAIPAGGVLLVLTARPVFRPAWSGACHETLDIGPLVPADHQELIRTLVEIHGVDEELSATIAARSDGNPLFTEELAKAISLGGESPIADMIPTNIRDLLTARLDALNGNKRFAQIAAVIGREVDAEVLRSAVGMSAREVSARLGELVNAGIMEPVVGPGPVTHRFVHALVRDAAYDSQERSHDRRDAHRRVARAMQQAAPDAGLIAQHLDAADDLDQAIAYYLVAATNAQRGAADVEAIGRLDRALALTERLEPGPARDVQELNIRILRGLSTVNLQGYAAPAAAEDYRRGLELSERAGTGIAVFPATVGTWAYYAVHGDLHASAQAVDHLTAMIQPEIDAEVLSCTAVQRFFEGRFDDAQEVLKRAFASFASRPNATKATPGWLLPNDPLVAALTHAAVVAWVSGDTRRAAASFAEAEERAAQLAFPTGPFSQAYALSYDGWLANLTGRYEEGRTIHEQTIAIGQQYGLVFWVATGTCHWAISRAHLGELEEAVVILEPAIEQWRALGAEAFVPCLRTHLAEIRLALGQVDAALHDVDQALAQAERTGERWFSAESHRVRAAVMCRISPRHLDDAWKELIVARRLAAEQGAHMFELRALLDALELRTADEQSSHLPDLRELVEGCAPGSVGRDLDRARALLDTTS
jgi:class 3 adenylate cyclase/predicted ATPase